MTENSELGILRSQRFLQVLIPEAIFRSQDQGLDDLTFFIKNSLMQLYQKVEYEQEPISDHGPTGFRNRSYCSSKNSKFSPDNKLNEHGSKRVMRHRHRAYFGDGSFTSTYLNFSDKKTDMNFLSKSEVYDSQLQELPQNAKVTKVGLIGNSEAGKSCLLNALLSADACPSIAKTLDVTNSVVRVVREIEKDTFLQVTDCPGFLHKEKLKRKIKNLSTHQKNTDNPFRQKPSVGSVAFSEADVKNVLLTDNIEKEWSKPDVILAVVDSTSMQSKQSKLPVDMKKILDTIKKEVPETPINLVLTKYDARFCSNLNWVASLCLNKIGGVHIASADPKLTPYKSRNFDGFDHVFLTSSLYDVGIFELREYLLELGRERNILGKICKNYFLGQQ